MARQTDDELVELLYDVSRNDRLSIELEEGTTCVCCVEWNKSRRQQSYRRQEDRQRPGAIMIGIEIDRDEIPAPLDVFPTQIIQIGGKQQPDGNYTRPHLYISEDEPLPGPQSNKLLNITRIDIEDTT